MTLHKKFRVKLEKPPSIGAWTYFVVPFNVEKVFGVKGHVKVSGTINGIPFRTIISPHDEHSHYMIVNKSIREQANIGDGTEVEVEMMLDIEPRVVLVPDLLKTEFNRDEKARQLFNELSYSHQKLFVKWITAAKKEKISYKRAQQAIQMLRDGKRIK